METTPFAGSLGVRVDGLDPAGAIDVVADLLDRHLVVGFASLDPSPAELRAIAAGLGDLEIHPYLTAADPSVPEVVSLDSSATPAADVWHTDATFLENPPEVGILHMVTAPATGGDTMWINCFEVYDSLSPAMQGILAGLTCIHDDGRQGELQAEHPLVRVEPRSGRRALFVNKQFGRRIPQLSRPESQALLGFLFRWQEQVRFSCRWNWQVGDVVFWDERFTLHAVVDDLPEDRQRVLHRATVFGEPPVGVPNESPWPRSTSNKMAASGYYGIANRGVEF